MQSLLNTITPSYIRTTRYSYILRIGISGAVLYIAILSFSCGIRLFYIFIVNIGLFVTELLLIIFQGRRHSPCRSLASDFRSPSPLYLRSKWVIVAE
jgi:hypothetical protein